MKFIIAAVVTPLGLYEILVPTYNVQHRSSISKTYLHLVMGTHLDPIFPSTEIVAAQ